MLTKKRKASFGTIIRGTLRAEDLIPAFTDALRYLRGSLPREVHRTLQQWQRGEVTEEHEALFLDSLFDELQEYAPPYAYFGAHEGDGSDFGFWLGDLDGAFDGLRVSDTSEVPSDYTGEVLHVNDHGNTTLYVSRGGKLREIWTIV